MSRRASVRLLSWLAFVIGWMGALSFFSVAPAAQADIPPQLAVEGGSEILARRCGICHGSDLVTQQRLSRAGWSREIDKMIGWGAPVETSEKDVLATYLAARSDREPDTAHAADVLPSTDQLLTSKCTVCHGLDLVNSQRLTAAGWTREIDKMAGWGAAITDAEKQLLVQHLAARPWNSSPK